MFRGVVGRGVAAGLVAGAAVLGVSGCSGGPERPSPLVLMSPERLTPDQVAGAGYVAGKMAETALNRAVQDQQRITGGFDEDSAGVTIESPGVTVRAEIDFGRPILKVWFYGQDGWEVRQQFDVPQEVADQTVDDRQLASGEVATILDPNQRPAGLPTLTEIHIGQDGQKTNVCIGSDGTLTDCAGNSVSVKNLDAALKQASNLLSSDKQPNSTPPAAAK